MAKKEIKLGNRIINAQSTPYLIAEIGINHNGDMQIAKKLIDAANATSWDAVKFQKRCPDIAVPEAQKSVMRETPWGTMTYLDYKKHIEFEKPEYDVIDAYCREKPIAWSASPWDMPSLEFLLQYDVPFIKIASATNDNEEIVKEDLKYAEEKECKNELLDLMPNGSFIHPISVKTFLRYAKYNKEIDFAQYSNKEYNFDELNNILINHDMKSSEVQNIISDIYSDYGELVAIGFFIGKYVITISHNEKLDIKSGGNSAFSISPLIMNSRLHLFPA